MEKMQKRYRIFFVVGIVALIGIAGIYQYRSGNKEQVLPSDAVSGGDGAPQNVGNKDGSRNQAGEQPRVTIGGVEGTGDFTVETVPLPASRTLSDIKKPELDRPLVFSSVFNEEARRLMTDKIRTSIAAIKKNPGDLASWTDLGVLRNTIDDYKGAEEIWRYLIAAAPDNAGPYINLANLYAFELKNPSAAEENFKKALEKGPKEVSAWRAAYEFYRRVRMDEEKARETLKKGIAETRSPDLQYLLDHYGEL